MKNLFFVLAFMLIGASFATNTVEKVSTFDVESTAVISKIEYKMIETLRCYRTCYYRGGELLSCTAWECAILLPEVVIE